MMSDNYRDFVRVFLEYGLYRKAVCYMASKIMDASTDVCGYGRYHNWRVEDNANYIKEIEEQVATQDEEDYIYTTKYARGINPSTTIAVVAEIEEALGNLSSDKDRERYICAILRDLHKGYSAVEELYTNPKYKDLRKCVGCCLDNKEDDNESEDKLVIFAYNAYYAYNLFIDDLFSICLKYGINLEYLQDKYELHIMHEWSEKNVIRTIGGEKTYKVLCADLEHPLRKDKRLTKNKLSNIWEQLVVEGYISGVKATFIKMYQDVEYNEKPKYILKWNKKTTKGVAVGALTELLDLLGKDNKEMPKVFDIYFGLQWQPSYWQRAKQNPSKHKEQLKEIISKEE